MIINTIKKLLLAFILLFTCSFLHADEDGWDIYQFKIYFENDLFAQQDHQYTSGEKFNLTYHINNPQSSIYDLLISSGSKADFFTSFSVVNQMFTPFDLSKIEPILNDRPYAGWTFIEGAIHKSTKNSLNTITLQVGMVGPSSKTGNLQRWLHVKTDSSPPMGWKNQIKDELGVNLSYLYKWRFTPYTSDDFQTSFIPYTEIDLGNVSTQASVGLFTRFGWNIQKDFGLSTIDMGGETGIPVWDEQQITMKKDFGFSLNLTASGSAVARDIFLDGNTNKQSQTFKKNPFVGYVGAGFTIRYKSLLVDFMQTKNTKKSNFEGEKKVVGTVLLSWIF